MRKASTRHVLSASQFNKNQLAELFKSADRLKKLSKDPAARRKLASRHTGRHMCSIFFQPSTRTRLSFETAASKLGIGVISTENAGESSSSVKGETLEDTIRILNSYDYDVIVMRHPEKGAVARVAKLSPTPLINAGDGTGEHPTQALLDTYTINQDHGRLDNLNIVFGGDIVHGRTVHSLAMLLAKFKNNRLTFVSLPELQADSSLKKLLRNAGTKFQQTDNMDEVLKDADVVYWTRLQREYIKDPKKVPKTAFMLSKKTIKDLPKTATIMHPLPRVDEIHTDVDTDPRAKYFQQASNGLYVRMALLDGILAG